MSYIVQGLAVLSLMWLIATGVHSANVMTPDYPLTLRLLLLSPAFVALLLMAMWTRTFDMYNPLETGLLLIFAFCYHKAADHIPQFLDIFNVSQYVHPRNEPRLMRYLHSHGEDTSQSCGAASHWHNAHD